MMMMWHTVSAALLFIVACFAFLFLLNIGEASWLNLSIVVFLYALFIVVPVLWQFITVKEQGRHVRRD